jgi:tetratricopeptide (TPR) repeat protein
MFPNLKARKLYMEAMSYTWALNENDYNISWRYAVETALKLLQESVKYEPNASYTLLALGIHYNYLYEFEKANQAFQKYLELRPYDAYARFSLAQMYVRFGAYEKAEPIFISLMEKYPETNVDYRLNLFDLYLKSNNDSKAIAIANELMLDPETISHGYFLKGIYYVYEDKLDSSVYYYNKCKESNKYYRDLCDNNIGHSFFVHGQVDSARKYFQRVIDNDSTYTHAHFNLGVIEAQEGNLKGAFNRFYKAVINASGNLEGFVTNMQLYLGKKYTIKDQQEFEKFRRKTHTFNMQYLSYLCIIYTYIRIRGTDENKDNIDFFFDQLFTYKQHEMITWYHRACYYALRKDKTTALESLDKALSKGFGSYFQVSSDTDLDFIRDTPEFSALVKKYFPGEKTGK